MINSAIKKSLVTLTCFAIVCPCAFISDAAVTTSMESGYITLQNNDVPFDRGNFMIGDTPITLTIPENASVGLVNGVKVLLKSIDFGGTQIMYNLQSAHKLILERESNGAKFSSKPCANCTENPIVSSAGGKADRLSYSFDALETSAGERFKVSFVDSTGAPMKTVRYAACEIKDGNCIFNGLSFYSCTYKKEYAPVYSIRLAPMPVSPSKPQAKPPKPPAETPRQSVACAADKEGFGHPMAFARKYVVQDCVNKMFSSEFMQEKQFKSVKIVSARLNNNSVNVVMKIVPESEQTDYVMAGKDKSFPMLSGRVLSARELDEALTARITVQRIKRKDGKFAPRKKVTADSISGWKSIRSLYALSGILGNENEELKKKTAGLRDEESMPVTMATVADFLGNGNLERIRNPEALSAAAIIVSTPRWMPAMLDMFNGELKETEKEQFRRMASSLPDDLRNRLKEVDDKLVARGFDGKTEHLKMLNRMRQHQSLIAKARMDGRKLFILLNSGGRSALESVSDSQTSTEFLRARLESSGTNLDMNAVFEGGSGDALWCVIADYSYDMDDYVPVLVSANFNFEALSRCANEAASGDGELANIATKTAVFDKDEFVYVCKGGGVQTFKIYSSIKDKTKDWLRKIFMNGDKYPRKYLTPKGIVEVGLPQ